MSLAGHTPWPCPQALATLQSWATNHGLERRTLPRMQRPRNHSPDGTKLTLTLGVSVPSWVLAHRQLNVERPGGQPQTLSAFARAAWGWAWWMSQCPTE